MTTSPTLDATVLVRSATNMRAKSHLPPGPAGDVAAGTQVVAWCGKVVRDAELVRRTTTDVADRCVRCETEAARRTT